MKSWLRVLMSIGFPIFAQAHCSTSFGGQTGHGDLTVPARLLLIFDVNLVWLKTNR